MRVLQRHHIVDMYVGVDEFVQKRKVDTEERPVGRSSVLSDSELLTIIVWDGMTERHHTMKGMYEWIQREHSNEFPELPKYGNFVAHIHRVFPLLKQLLEALFVSGNIRFADSTMLDVCTLKRAEDHRTAQRLAKFGKNWQGWHYGFKLHASIREDGALCGIHFSPANTFDAQMIEHLVDEDTDILVGDSHYGASVMRRIIYKMFGTRIIAPPHHTQKKSLLNLGDNVLLRKRSKIESVFDELKQHSHLVSSFPRSIKGYFVHYYRVLLGYQLRVIS